MSDDAFAKLLKDAQAEGAHRNRRMRKSLGLPDIEANGLSPKKERLPNEDAIIRDAAIDTLTYIENAAKEVVVRDPETISELALDNTLHASKVLNQILRQYYHEIKTSGTIDIKRDRLAADVANATMRTLARVHEVHLRGQQTDRLAQILEEIKQMETSDR